MQSEDRVIHFSTELIHPPSEHRLAVLQGLYYDLAQARCGYDSSDFTNSAQARFYSVRPKATQSAILFMPDRVVFVEEWADISVNQFCDKVRQVSERVMSKLGIALFTAQTVTLRSTFALSHCEDARVFLLERACGLQGRISPHFRRPIAIGGLRFLLPETPEHKGAMHVQIESFKGSQNEVFVEVKGVYTRLSMQGEQLEGIRDNIRGVRSFITDNIFSFLNQYDRPVQEAHD